MAKNNSSKYFVVIIGDEDDYANEVTVLGVYSSRKEALMSREKDVKKSLGSEEDDLESLEGNLKKDDYVSDGHTFWKLVEVK